MLRVFALYISLALAQASATQDMEVMWCKPVRDGSGKPELPPPVAACEDKDESEPCSFSHSKGMKPLKGTCTLSERKGKKVMWCKPSGDGSGKLDVPPPVAACKGKDEDEPCDFSHRKGKKSVNGTCTLSEKKGKKVMWCKPSGDGSGKPDVPPPVAACEGKDEDEPCDFSHRKGQKSVNGTCTLSEKKGKKVMWCKSSGDGSGKPDVPPPVAACKGKDEDEPCDFSHSKGKKSVNGTCTLSDKKGKKVMWCKPSRDGSGRPDVPPPVAACKGKNEGETCSFSRKLGAKPLKGQCTWSAGNDKKVIKSGDTVFLQTRSGRGNHIDVEGSAVQARWKSRGNWQAIFIEKKIGGIINSGDTVYLKSHTGAHIHVTGEAVNAEWNDQGDWQAMIIEKRTGSGGAILPNDLVCFRAHTGKHLGVVDTAVQARSSDCGEWEAMIIEKEESRAIFSGYSIHLAAHTGKRIDVEGHAVQARWSEAGDWQTFAIKNYGGRAIFSGDAVFLKAHTGMLIDVQGVAVQARWDDHGLWQHLVIENKKGSGAIYPGDTIFLRAHTGKIIDVEGDAVQARWSAKDQWQSLIIEKAASQRRLVGTKDDEPALGAPQLLLI